MPFTQKQLDTLNQASGMQTQSSAPSLADKIMSWGNEPKMTNGGTDFLKGTKETLIGEERTKRVKDIVQPWIEGKQGNLSTGAQLGGEIIRGGTEAVANLPVIKQGLDLVGGFLKGLSETEPIKTAGAGLEPLTVKVTDWYKGQTPEAQRNIDATVQYLSVLPVGKAGEVGLQGALKTTEKAVETGLKGAVTSSKVLSDTGSALKASGGKLYQSAITPTTQEAERILAYEAKNPLMSRISNVFTGEVQAPITRATTAMEKGIAGTEKMVGVQARRASEDLWTNKIAPAVKNSTDVVSKEDLFAPIEKRIADTIEPSKKKAYQEAYDAIKEDYADVSTFNLEDAQSVKRTLDAYTPEKIFRGKNVASEVNTLNNDMANAIRQKTYNSLKDVNIKKDYLDYANLSELEKVGVKAISEAGTKGGFGGFWSTMWSAATTPVKTVGGQVLYRVGDKLEFLGDKGIKTFGEYLKNSGFSEVSGASPLLNVVSKASENFDAGLSVKNIGEQNVKKFVASKPPFGLLKDLQTYIDQYYTKGEIPYDNFLADIVEQFENRNIILPKSESGLAKFFTDILNKTDYAELKTPKIPPNTVK